MTRRSSLTSTGAAVSVIADDIDSSFLKPKPLRARRNRGGAGRRSRKTVRGRVGTGSARTQGCGGALGEEGRTHRVDASASLSAGVFQSHRHCQDGYAGEARIVRAGRDGVGESEDANPKRLGGPLVGWRFGRLYHGHRALRLGYDLGGDTSQIAAERRATAGPDEDVVRPVRSREVEDRGGRIRRFQDVV